MGNYFYNISPKREGSKIVKVFFVRYSRYFVVLVFVAQ